MNEKINWSHSLAPLVEPFFITIDTCGIFIHSACFACFAYSMWVLMVHSTDKWKLNNTNYLFLGDDSYIIIKPGPHWHRKFEIDTLWFDDCTVAIRILQSKWQYQLYNIGIFGIRVINFTVITHTSIQCISSIGRSKSTQLNGTMKKTPTKIPLLLNKKFIRIFYDGFYLEMKHESDRLAYIYVI